MVPRLRHVDLMLALERATTGFGHVVNGVADEAWSSASPCVGWTVRDVVNHVVGGNIMAVRLLDGASAARAIDGLFDADLLGDATQDVVRRTGAEQLTSFGRPGALEMTVHHPATDLPADVFLALRVAELLVHGWDIATGSGQDDHLDETAAIVLWDAIQPLLPVLVDRGVYGEGPSGSVPDDAPVSRRLLDAMGRRP